MNAKLKGYCMETQKGLGMYGVLKTVNGEIDLSKDSFTSKQAADLTKLSIQATRSCLNRLVNDGLLIVTEHRDPKNYNCRIVRYRLNVSEFVKQLLYD